MNKPSTRTAKEVAALIAAIVAERGGGETEEKEAPLPLSAESLRLLGDSAPARKVIWE